MTMAKTKRRSLSERDAAAIAGGLSLPEPEAPQPTAEPAPPPTAEPAPPRPGKAAAKPLRSTATSATRKLGVYLSLAVFEDAKSAYLVDFDDIDGPDTFAGWVDVVMARFAGLDPTDRAAAIDGLPETDVSSATQRSWSVSEDTMQAITDAISADRHTGRITSRSQFAVDALRSAIAAAAERRGGRLPTAPRRLPNRLTR